MGIRTRSDRFVTSDASLPAVHDRPDFLKAVRPGGSQHGSQRDALTTPEAAVLVVRICAAELALPARCQATAAEIIPLIVRIMATRSLGPEMTGRPPLAAGHLAAAP